MKNKITHKKYVGKYESTTTRTSQLRFIKAYFTFCIFQIITPKINQVILWVTPRNTSLINLNKLGLPQKKGFATQRNSEYTVKISKTGLLNIYIRRPIISTLSNITGIILNFYKFVQERTGYNLTGLKLRITNVHASFEHKLNHFALLKRRQHLEQQNIKFIDLKEELHFKHKCKYGTVAFLPKRGTIISKDIIQYCNFVKFIEENILF